MNVITVFSYKCELSFLPPLFQFIFISQLRKMQQNRRCLFHVKRSLSLAAPFSWLATLHLTQASIGVAAAIISSFLERRSHV
jgi:hypothetical protein